MVSVTQLFWRLLGKWKLGGNAQAFGPFTVIDKGSIRVGTNLAINHGAFLIGRSGIDIGNDVVISAGAMLVAAGLDPRTFGREQLPEYADTPIRIADRVWIGAGAIVLGGVSIGKGAIVGAGSVVTRDVPDHVIVAGNPARVVREIEQRHSAA